MTTLITAAEETSEYLETDFFYGTEISSKLNLVYSIPTNRMIYFSQLVFFFNLPNAISIPNFSVCFIHPIKGGCSC